MIARVQKNLSIKISAACMSDALFYGRNKNSNMGVNINAALLWARAASHLHCNGRKFSNYRATLTRRSTSVSCVICFYCPRTENGYIWLMSRQLQTSKMS
jgi:hypothetical protein